MATDPDGTANNGDETYTVGAEVTNLTGELDTYDGTDNSTFIGDLDGTTDTITSLSTSTITIDTTSSRSRSCPF